MSEIIWHRQQESFNAALHDYRLVIGEFFFSLALQSVRYLTKNEFDFELMMRFGVGSEMLGVMSIFGGALALIVGWMADNYLGKLYISLFGVSLAICACTCATLNLFLPSNPVVDLNTIAKMMFMTYISTSGVRNAFLLEQYRVCRTRLSFRKLMFLFTFARLLTYTVTPIFESGVLNVRSELMMTIGVLGVVLSCMYLLFLLYILPHLYLEATYFRVWAICTNCCLTALANRKVQQTEPIITNPPKRSLIKKKKRRRIWFWDMIMRRPPRNKVKFSQVVTIRFRERAYHEVLPEPPVTSRFWGHRGINFPYKKQIGQFLSQHPSQLIRRRKFKFEEKTISDPVIVVKRCHWMRYARPEYPEYIITQTRKLISIIPMIIPPFFFTLFGYIITSVVNTQQNYGYKPEYEPPAKLSQPCILMDVITFPVVEFVAYYCLSETSFKQFHSVFIGYISLLSAAAAAVYIQIRFEATMQYIPNSQTAQFRVFNNIAHTSIVYTAWTPPERVLPYQHALFKGIPTKSNHKFQVKIITPDTHTVKLNQVKVVSQKTVSFLILPGSELVENSEFDPTIFSEKRNDRKCVLFLLTNLRGNENSIVIWKPNERFRRVNITSNNRGLPYEFNPGCYNFTGHSGRRKSAFGEFCVRHSTLYAFSFGFDKQLFGSLIALEGPVELPINTLLIPHVFLSTANAFASISFYHILFASSPAKLRSSVFSAIVASNLLATAVFNLHFANDAYHSSKPLMIIIGLFAGVAILYIIALRNTFII